MPPDEPPLPFDDAEIAALREAVLRWYDEEHRPLPWRLEPSEYRTVVSEFMLQQTQVATVIPYFERFIKLFPNWRRLAAADEQQVLAAWAGLGYYRRARLLKRLAELVVRRYKGRLPRDPNVLRELPGMGDYTVGAVGSIALGLALPAVDGNVRRVVARLAALSRDPARGAGRRRLWAISAALVDPQRPGDFNQGLMELGATVCLPREPLCLICPCAPWCRGRRAGAPERYPPPAARPPIEPVREVAVALFRGDRVLLVQRAEQRSFAGMWEFPRLDTRQTLDGALTPQLVLYETVRARAERFELVGRVESAFTRYRISTELYRAHDAAAGPIRRTWHVAHQWIRPAAAAHLPMSKAQQRLLALLTAPGVPARPARAAR